MEASGGREVRRQAQGEERVLPHLRHEPRLRQGRLPHMPQVREQAGAAATSEASDLPEAPPERLICFSNIFFPILPVLVFHTHKLHNKHYGLKKKTTNKILCGQLF